ncbi:MAG: NAD-glutamate dehydrogenase, partial [Pseudolabrys sp.]|nr:NAD-glutamate dehydrogenase [Pseudolabrys sp.]
MPADRTIGSDLLPRVDLDSDIVVIERPANKLEEFAAALFARATPEDLRRYQPSELAEIAARTWQFLETRTPGTPNVRVSSPAIDAGPALKSVTVVEIVNDDMPFLVDSVMAELNDRRLEIYLVAHPVIAVQRDAAGKLTGFAGDPARLPNAPRESVIHIHIERLDDDAANSELAAALTRVLTEVRRAVEDWKAILARVSSVVAQIKANPPPVPVDEIGESVQFLEWLAADNFVFLGVREYRIAGDGAEYEPLPDSGLGILRAENIQVLPRAGERVSITPKIREFLNEPKALIITKANVRSRVHRRV